MGGRPSQGRELCVGSRGHLKATWGDLALPELVPIHPYHGVPETRPRWPGIPPYLRAAQAWTPEVPGSRVPGPRQGAEPKPHATVLKSQSPLRRRPAPRTDTCRHAHVAVTRPSHPTSAYRGNPAPPEPLAKAGRERDANSSFYSKPASPASGGSGLLMPQLPQV